MATQTLDSLKINLIVEITNLDDETILYQIAKIIDKEKKQPTERQLELLKKLSKPMRKKTDINEIKKEQNWKGIDREKFDRLVKELNIQEPLEQLIADIGR
jgi:hypothetical protein